VRFCVVTYGSEGDARPVVAICRGLQDAGHEVSLFLEQSTIGNARLHGISVRALTGDIRSTLPMSNPTRELRGSDVLKAIKDGLRAVRSNTLSWMTAILDDARQADAILFGGLASPMMETIASRLRKPAIHLCLQPTTATREFPACTLPPKKFPGWFNLLTDRVSPKAMMRRLYGDATRSAAKKIFGKESRAKPGAEFPILYGFSRYLVPRPGDWPANHEICGYWPLPPLAWRAPDALLEFLAAGEPPIYVGFGAVSSFVRPKKLAEITAALAGRRALFFPGWSEITSDMLPANVLVIGDTPHSWLFPRTSMVIHHCGAGTTHAAAQAGVPSIPLPFGADQFFWAGRLGAAGVAPKYVSGTKIVAKSLASMIEFASRVEVRERARALGISMSMEGGVGCAVKSIEAQMAALIDVVPASYR